MGRAALSQAHRLYTFSETLLVSFAQANIPYAIEILLLLQFAELLIARAVAHSAAVTPNLARWFATLDARPAFSTAVTKAAAVAAGWGRMTYTSHTSPTPYRDPSTGAQHVRSAGI